MNSQLNPIRFGHVFHNNGVIFSDGIENDAEIQIIDEKGIKHVIKTEEIAAKKKQTLSLMPADLHKELSVQDLVDVVEYLMVLKKKED